MEVAVSIFRKIILTAVLFVAACPPWKYTAHGGSFHSEKPAGHFFVFAPPRAEREGGAFGVSIDVSRLLIEWILLGSIAAWALHSRKLGETVSK